MPTIPLTRRGAEKLKEELTRLKTVERHAVIQAIAEARAQGDLSENAEYDAAKDKQGFIEGRIAEIEGKLSAAQIINPAELDAGGRVVFGSTVEMEIEATGDVVTYQIVGDDEADLKKVLSENAASVYGFDLDKLQVLADRIGPTVEELATPLTEVPDHQSPAFQRA